jgi:hypothetical protein
VIDRPKRSVTRFFVPMIDVLILLFCIFLLMPFAAESPSNDESLAKEPMKLKAPEEDLPADVVELRRELERVKRDYDRLKSEKGNLSERLSVKVLEIDPVSGKLYYLQDGTRVDVNTQAAAESLITQHKRQSGTKDPFFLILFPRQKSGFPEQRQADDYARWFRDVQFQFDRPF